LADELLWAGDRRPFIVDEQPLIVDE